MSAGPSTFKRTDVKRLVQAAESAGKKVGRVELQAGKIVLVLNEEPTATPRNPWDKAIDDLTA